MSFLKDSSSYGSSFDKSSCCEEESDSLQGNPQIDLQKVDSVVTDQFGNIIVMPEHLKSPQTAAAKSAIKSEMEIISEEPVEDPDKTEKKSSNSL